MSVSGVVLPGDELLVRSSTALGPGTRKGDDGKVYSTTGGVVRGKAGKKVWVDFNSKRVSIEKNDYINLCCNCDEL